MGKKLSVFALVLMLAASLLSACGNAGNGASGGDSPSEGGSGSGGSAAEGEIYIPIISKGFQHQFWQAVKSGAEQAGQELGVRITFEGPETESQVDKQIEMLQAALDKKPSAIGFAALDSQASIPLLKKAQENNIPVIAFDLGGKRYSGDNGVDR